MEQPQSQQPQQQQQRQCSSPARREVSSSSEFNLREWGMRARISRENTNSRRHSASFIRSFREDTTTRLSSFRSNITISSSASSPGYSSLRDEIDPSTYSFTTALQALQARSMVYNSWECMSPEGFALNSKWSEAEKYICNPLSGEFPRECLSSKTLSGRSSTNRITMSAPLLYSQQRHSQTRPYYHNYLPQPTPNLPIQEKRMEAVTTTLTRDVGTQSTPPELSSGSLSPASTPSIIERSLNHCGVEAGESPASSTKLIISQEQVKVIETQEDDDEEEENKKETNEKQKEENNNNSKQKHRRGNNGNNGCLSWMTKRQRHRDKHKHKHSPRKTILFLLPNLKGC